MLGVVIAGGDAPAETQAVGLEAAHLVVAADGGVKLARRLGLRPTHLVGDLDSADAADVEWARSVGADVERHEVDKDRTDLELALAAAARAGATKVIVLGAEGGRLDHALGNWSALAGADIAVVEARGPGGTTHVVRSGLDMTIEPGRLVSILPWGGSAIVTTRGLRWELEHEELSPFEARGVSNEAVLSEVRIAVAAGVALVVCPEVD